MINIGGEKIEIQMDKIKIKRRRIYDHLENVLNFNGYQSNWIFKKNIFNLNWKKLYKKEEK